MIDASQELLMDTLAASSTFQTLVGAANSTEALARIHGDALPKPSTGSIHTAPELEALRPCAIVYIPADFGWQVERNAAGDVSGGTDSWHPSGAVHCSIYRSVPAVDKDDYAKVDKDFRVIVGDIISDLIAAAETPGRLACHKITAMGPYRTKQDQLKAIGDAQVYELVCEWGHR